MAEPRKKPVTSDYGVIWAILYLRLSDLRDVDLRDGDSIEDHLKGRELKLRELASRLGYQVPPWGVIVENDINQKTGKPRPASAYKRRLVTLPDGSQGLRVIRPRFREVLDHLMAGRAQALLTEDLDRCVRDPRDLEDLIDVAQMRKVNARSLASSLTFTDGGTDSEITTARIMVAIANKSSRDTGRRVAAERERMALSGRHGGGTRPYGWEKDGQTPVPEEYKIIAEMSRRAIQLDPVTGKSKESMRLLAAELRERGVKTAQGHEWTAQGLRDMLVRPRNAGIMIYRDEEVGQAPYEAPVKLHIFRAVQRLLNDPERVTAPSGPGAGPKYLGSGIFLCGVCNNGTYMVVTKGRYTCAGVQLRGGTYHVARNVTKLDAFVENGLVLHIASGKADQFLDLATGSGALDIDVDALQAERSSIEAELVGLAEDRALGHITRAQMLKSTQIHQARLFEIENQLSAVIVDSPVVPLIEAARRNKGAADAVRKAWRAQPLANQRAVVSTLLSVTVQRTSTRGVRFDPNAIQMLWKEPGGSLAR